MRRLLVPAMTILVPVVYGPFNIIAGYVNVWREPTTPIYAPISPIYSDHCAALVVESQYDAHAIIDSLSGIYQAEPKMLRYDAWSVSGHARMIAMCSDD